MSEENYAKSDIIKAHCKITGTPFIDIKLPPDPVAPEFVLEIDAIIGLAKADDKIRDYLVEEVFSNFEEQVIDLIKETAGFDI
jgi:hypothetical protein